MAPKPKPKSKKELKAEQESAARAAEEERLRQEEEEKRAAEHIELQRQELFKDYTRQRDARLNKQRHDLVAILQHMRNKQEEMEKLAAEAADWESYLSCSALPDPRDEPAMNDFLQSLGEDTVTQDVQKTLQQCEACLQLAQQCRNLALKESMAAALHDAWCALATGKTAQPAATALIATTSAEAAAATGSAQAVAQQGQQENSRPASRQAIGNNPVELASTAATACEADVATAASATEAKSSAVWDAAACKAMCEACGHQAARYTQHAATLCDSIMQLTDAATAYILHRADEHADPKGDVLLTAQQGTLQFGLWVNTQKNPRFKLVDFTGIGISIEIPKQLALANIALRVQHHQSPAKMLSSSAVGLDTSPGASKVCLEPLGGVISVELLALPPAPKHSRGWTIRQVSPLTHTVNTVPYPVPPVGPDPATWHPDEEPPPLRITVKLPERLLVPAAVCVGWWDGRRGAWSQEGISNISYNTAAGVLTFSSTHTGQLALLQDTSAYLPYRAWTIRPTGGMGGSTAMVDLQVSLLPGSDSTGAKSTSAETISLEVGSGWVRLCGPVLPQLAHLIGKPLPLWELLPACAACGLRLSPGAEDLAAQGLTGKDRAVEHAMCADLALMCTTFLVSSSKWNQGAGENRILLRLSEVLDWEEGGRTSSQATARIFGKEASEGPTKVTMVQREGEIGICWIEGRDSASLPPLQQDLSTIKAVQAAIDVESSWAHASLPHLLDDAQMMSADGGRKEYLGACSAVDAGFVMSMAQLLQSLRVFACS